jgi:DNA-binding PadR family transcriptional regulator
MRDKGKGFFSQILVKFGALCYDEDNVWIITMNRDVGPMAVFLMAAVSRAGLDTVYAMQRAARLQPGSLEQVIRELVSDGLLVRSEAAKRRRRAISLTDAGAEFLAQEWKHNLDAKREMESILRNVTVALLMDDIGEAIGFLHGCADERERKQGPRELSEASLEGTPIDLHEAMRDVYETRRREMERDVLREFESKLSEWAMKREGNQCR